MWPNPQETADLVTFTEQFLTGKFHFLYSDCNDFLFRSSLAPQKEQLISSEPIKHFWLGQHSSKILFYICLKIKKIFEWLTLLFYSKAAKVVGQILHFSTSQKKTKNISTWVL